MTDVYSGHSQFILLTENRRRWFDGRTLFLITVVTVPVVIFCGIYTIILKGNESLLYPKSSFEVPPLLTHRAKIYGSYAKHRAFEPIHSIQENSSQIDEFKLVCYYNFPRDASSGLQPENIDPFLCTHINVGFASISNNSVFLIGPQLAALAKVVALKNVNPALKVLVSVGGAGNGDFDIMVENHLKRKTFIRSVLELVKKRGIDGVDLDWEFPRDNQKVHFVQLLEEFRSTINKQTRHKFLLSLAVAAPVVIIDTAYKVSYINQYVDYVNVMTYDFHFFTKTTPFTGHNSPLFPSFEDKGFFLTLNINYSAHYWLTKGLNRDKLMIGLPTYGHSYRLVNPHNNGLFAPARGYGNLGGRGFVDYTQVCKFMNLNRITPIFDSNSKSIYVTKGAEWVSFDNEHSLSLKTEYVRDYQFGGVMVYSLNSDDYMGDCKVDPNVENRAFPLVNKVREILDSNYSIF